MLKIKDNTSKQNLDSWNVDFWSNKDIKNILIKMKSIRNGTIYINDCVVEEYNKITNQTLPKSNASFVRQVRKLNKENYFDDLVDKAESDGEMNKEEFLKAIMELPKIETNNPISAMNSINVDDLMSAVDRLNKIPDYNDLLKENQKLKKQLEERKYYKFYKYENNPYGSDHCFCERPCDSNMSLKCFFENGEIFGFMSESLVGNHDIIEEISLNEFAHDFIKPLINANFQNKNQQKEFIKYLEDEINKLKEQIKNYDIWHEVGTDINFLILKKQFYLEILQKYQETIGVSDDNKTTI